MRTTRTTRRTLALTAGLALAAGLTGCAEEQAGEGPGETVAPEEQTATRDDSSDQPVETPDPDTHTQDNVDGPTQDASLEPSTEPAEEPVETDDSQHTQDNVDGPGSQDEGSEG